MRRCEYCGRHVDPEATFCPQCGQSLITQEVKQGPSGMVTAAKVFMVLGTIIMAITGYLIPLLWCIPMTISYFNKVKNGEPVSTAFKICALLFVSLLGGIFMLCDNNSHANK